MREVAGGRVGQWVGVHSDPVQCAARVRGKLGHQRVPPLAAAVGAQHLGPLWEPGRGVEERLQHPKVGGEGGARNVEGRAALVPVLGLVSQLPANGRGEPAGGRVRRMRKQRRGVGGVPGVRPAATPVRTIKVKHKAHARGGGKGGNAVPALARHANVNPWEAKAATIAARAAHPREKHRVRSAAANAELRGRRRNKVGGEGTERRGGKIKVVVN